MWAAKVEPDWVFWVRFDLNQSRTRVFDPDFARNLHLRDDRKSSIVQKDSDNYSNIHSKGTWYIILGKNRSKKCKAGVCEFELAGPDDQNSRSPESQKSRNPVFQWHVMFIQRRNKEAVSQWARGGSLVNEWAKEPGRHWISERVYRKGIKLCLCRRFVFERSVKIDFQKFFGKFVRNIAEFLFIMLQSPS